MRIACSYIAREIFKNHSDLVEKFLADHSSVDSIVEFILCDNIHCIIEGKIITFIGLNTIDEMYYDDT